MFQLNVLAQNKFLIQMFTWLKIAHQFLHSRKMLDEWDYMLYYIYTMSDASLKNAIRSDVQVREIFNINGNAC